MGETTRTEDTTRSATTDGVDAAATSVDPAAVDDLLEDVSIDGMCGVY
jgi:mycofactocin precursor